CLCTSLADYSLNIQPTQRSTLLPYTTLFRSRSRTKPTKSRKRPKRARKGVRSCFFMGQGPPRGRMVPCQYTRQGRPCQGGGASQDRKSTRLNSSHVSISYAVFCLKNKIIS